MREPWFWRSRSLTARAIALTLAPLSIVYDGAQRFRWRMAKPERVATPVFCIGNATLGGVGKTPFAMLLHGLLEEAGVNTWFLTRGYGGAEKGPVKVDPEKHSADVVGDEALLLADKGKTVVSKDRVAGARVALAEGAQAIIMDDGFQNPSLEKTFSFLLMDGNDAIGNGRIFPAGPLREPMQRAKARAGATVSVGGDGRNGADFHAWLEPDNPPPGQKVVAFSGIGNPGRFFAMLEKADYELAEVFAFPDHHRFSESELKTLKKSADKKSASLITTEKDFVRLPHAFREHVLAFPVKMRIDDPEALKARLSSVIDAMDQTR